MFIFYILYSILFIIIIFYIYSIYLYIFYYIFSIDIYIIPYNRIEWFIYKIEFIQLQYSKNKIEVIKWIKSKDWIIRYVECYRIQYKWNFSLIRNLQYTQIYNIFQSYKNTNIRNIDFLFLFTVFSILFHFIINKLINIDSYMLIRFSNTKTLYLIIKLIFMKQLKK